MNCRTCGTEIADKAIVCYRCGAATGDVAPSMPAGRPRRIVVPVVAAFTLVVIGGLYMGMAARGNTPPLIYWIMLGLAVIVVVWRFAARR
jgi:hypothetical protein